MTGSIAKKISNKDFNKFRGLKKNLGRLLDRFQPDVVVSTFPPYPVPVGSNPR